MLWKRWWILSTVAILGLGGLGLWARGKLIGSEVVCPPTPLTATAAPVALPNSPTPPPPAVMLPSGTQPAPSEAVVSTPPSKLLVEPTTPSAVSSSAAPPVAPVAPTASAAPPLAPISPPPPPAPAPGTVMTPATPPPPPVTTSPEPPPPPASESPVTPARYRVQDPAPPAAGTSPTPPPNALAPCPWTLRVEIVEGRPLLEARNGKEVQLRVNCERLNLQAPEGTIVAQGTVKITAPDLDGVCDKLTISWQEDRVILEKEVRLKCRKDGQEVELTGERLTVKLTATAPAKSVDASSKTQKADYPASERLTPARPTKVHRDSPRGQTIRPFDGTPD